LADDSRLVTTDVTGASLIVPWAVIKRVRKTDRLFLMHMVAASWRYVPWRAFSAADQEALWQLAQIHAAAKTSSE
jgi:hypothetical protein